MAPYRSIMTTLYTFESLNSLMELFVTLYLISLTQIINKEPGPTRHLPLHRGTCVSPISLMSSCRRFVHFSSCSLALHLSFYAEHASFGNQGIQKVLWVRMCVEARLEKAFYPRVVLPGCFGHAQVERC